MFPLRRASSRCIDDDDDDDEEEEVEEVEVKEEEKGDDDDDDIVVADPRNSSRLVSLHACPRVPYVCCSSRRRGIARSILAAVQPSAGV